jgi:hypothetical protein
MQRLRHLVAGNEAEQCTTGVVFHPRDRTRERQLAL